MYYVYYDDEILHVPFSEDAVYDAKLSCEVNSSAYFDFTISSEHSMVNELQERSGIVTVYADEDLIFEGYITDYSDNIEGERSVSCASVLSYLNDTVVRPYSTKSGVYDLTAPKTPEDFFEWLITQHNNNVMGNKTFLIGDNDLDQLMDDESDGTFSRESDKVQTTAKEITDQLIDKLGGYLTLSYDWRGRRLVNYYATTPGINSQIIDFGENITDFSRKVDTDGQYTAVRPVGAKPENSDVGITIESLTDEDIDEDIVKEGDVVYSRNAVETYGYSEYAYEDNDIETKSALRSAAIAQLRQLLNPTTSVEVKAVDLSLYMDGYTHLLPGQLVRVRALPFGIDEYMLVNSIDIDINDPENTTFALGIAYDTLTGQQSETVGALNAAIDTQADAVSSLGDDVKAAADAAAKAAEDAAAAYALAQTIDLSGTHVHIKYSAYENGLQPGLGTWAEVKAAVGIWANAKYYTYSQVGSAMTDLPTAETEYIGILTDENEEAPSDPQKYAWALIKGEDGIQGKDGADGTSSYLHIKYSDYPNGYDDQGNPAIKETAGAYIGTYVNQNATDPEDPSVYTWVRIEGVDGADGTSVTILGSYDSLEDLEAAHPTGNKGDGYLVDGDLYVWNGLAWEDVGTIQGPSGETTYLHIAYANSSDGSVDFSLSDTEEREYMGTYTDFYEFDSTDPSRYTWVKIKGEDGEDGVGILAITVYYLASSKSDGVKNTDDGFTTDMQALSHTLKYLWSYQRIAYTNSLVELTDAVIIGVYGDTGDTGEKGETGEPGTDGTMLYGECYVLETIQVKPVQIISGNFELKPGVTVAVTFTYGNVATEPQLFITWDEGTTTALPIFTQGDNVAYWSAGATVVFTYNPAPNSDEYCWYCASTPVYASEVTVGNRADKHVFIDNTGLAIRDGADDYENPLELATFKDTSATIGQVTEENKNVNITADGVSIRQGEYPVATFKDSKISFSNISGEELGTFQTYTRGDFDYAALMTSGRRNIMLQSLDEETAQDGDILFSAVELAGQGQPSSGAYTPFARIGVGTRDNDLFSYIELREKFSRNLDAITDMAAEINIHNCTLTVESGNYATLTSISENTDTMFQADSWSGTSIRFGVGAGGTNRGIWDSTKDAWVLYVNSDEYCILGNPNYRVVSRGSWTIIRPGTTVSTSNVGRVFQVQANASNEGADADTSNALFCAGYNSDGPYIRSWPTYNKRTYNYSANLYITSNGYLGRATGSSAKNKRDINYYTNIEHASEAGLEKQPTAKTLSHGWEGEEPVKDEAEFEQDMHAVLDIPVVEFHYEEGFITGNSNYDYNTWVTGFVAEDVEKVCPEAVEYDEDGNVADWNIREIVPRMLYLIQEQDKRIAELEAKIEAMSNAD